MAAIRTRWASAAVIALAVIAVAAPVSARWVERFYSSGFYPLLQPPLTRLSNRVPFALDDVVLVGAGLAVLVWLVRALLSPRMQGLAFLRRTATLAAAILLVSIVTFGANFRRQPLRETAAFDASRVSADAVFTLAQLTVRVLNDTYDELPAQWPDDSAVRATLAPLFREAARAGAAWRPELARPKRSILDPWMRRIGMNGYFLPFFHEVAMNSALLPFERPYVLAHEWGHGLGRANESEAAYFGWLTCEKGPPWARYSAWLRVLDYVSADLSRDQRRALYAQLSEGPRRDIDASRRRVLAQYRPALRRVNESVTNRAAQVAGVGAEQRDYGLLVQLMLGMPPAP